VRGGYRLIPWWFRRAVYRPIVARYTEPAEQEPAEAAAHEAAEWEYPEMPAAGFWRDQTQPVGS
jgi:hypothetical protein